MIKINRQGVTRTVIITARWAVKVPSFRYGAFRWRWRNFLNGMLANLQEANFSDARWPELCPVLRSCPLGLWLVMPRARVMTDEEFSDFDYVEFVTRGDHYARENYRLRHGQCREGAEPEGLVIPAERKADSFGWLNGRVVAVDYGN